MELPLRVLVSQDEDILVEATRRQRTGGFFAGVIIAHQKSMALGQFIFNLELIAKEIHPEELINRVEFIPLK